MLTEVRLRLGPGFHSRNSIRHVEKARCLHGYQVGSSAQPNALCSLLSDCEHKQFFIRMIGS